jgi:hypothetical protein
MYLKIGIAQNPLKKLRLNGKPLQKSRQSKLYARKHDMADDFLDPYKYGKLVAQFETMEKKVDTMEADIKKLVMMAERSKGSLWAIMGAASVFGGFVTWMADLVFKK